MKENYDFIIVGAGIAGAASGYFLSPYGKTLILDKESVAGYHSTGRSAAIFLENYGNNIVRKLTKASRQFLVSPPEDFTKEQLVKKRGALFVANNKNKEKLFNLYNNLLEEKGTSRLLNREEVETIAPILKQEWIAGIYENDALDIDVNELHQSYLKGFKKNGGILKLDEEILSGEFIDNKWHIETTKNTISCNYIINASGAWGDKVAKILNIKPIDLNPLKRTAITLNTPTISIDDLPYIGDIDETFYIKPESNRLLASPCDEEKIEPSDVTYDDLMVAITVDTLEKSTNLDIQSINAKWAGIRTFTKDKTPIAGFALDNRNFFWLVGQGGYGIQTSPAMGIICRNLILGIELPKAFELLDLKYEDLSPSRLIIDNI